jgi:hypothetical protein
MKIVSSTASAFLVSVALLGANVGWASSWSVESPSEQAYLLELFTSQGCSSCPPADSWLSQLKQDPELFDRVVPVAYHVTYWDYLGWKDAFGHASHDARHRSNAAAVGAGVYTPGVFLQGKEWRGWRRHTKGPQGSSGSDVGVLRAVGTQDAVKVTFTPNHKRVLKQPRAHMTYLRSGQTNILSGENRSRDLHYDFIAGEVRSKPLHSGDDAWSVTFTFAAPVDAEAVAVWVDDENTYIQSTGGFVGR